MSPLSFADSPEIIDAALVHWMQVVVGTLFYMLNTHSDLVHSVHLLALFVHNPGLSHIKAIDHVLRYLARTDDLCLIVGNWTDADL
jgi:hypothetical protein